MKRSAPIKSLTKVQALDDIDNTYNLNDETLTIKKEIPKLSSKFDENDLYQVKFHYSQAIIALIINIGHLFFGPFIIPVFNLIFGKNLMHSMVFEFRWLYILGDFSS